MYSLLIGLTVLGSAFGIPISNEIATNDVTRDTELASLYVLPGESFPTFYDVRLVLDPSNVEYFYGNVSIRILTYFDTDEIVLHAMEMQIDAISVISDRDDTEELFDSYTLATDDTQLLRIKMTRNLTAMQPHTIHINYVGQFAENMFGVYVSTYPYEGRTVNLITSQLQPTYARRAFPCYDEPALKAVFRTTIYAPAAFPVVRSNTIERTDNLKTDIPGYLKYEFEDTLVMSTYLLAYLVSEFAHVENDVNPIFHAPFKVFSRPGTQESAAFALEFGQQNMVALEEYTEFKYEFPKMDKAAVPDFAAGAMENWGLVIYREVALLVTEGVTTTTTKQNIGRIICHENVHQWFGNEVGPLSWTYTWLNEGFASFFESFATDLVLPGWRMMDQFVVSTQNVFQSDAVLTINPMTHPVYTPSQILSTFNAVAYQKSGSVIRMMHHFLTPEVFRQGLIIYIRANTRRAAAPENLYAALQQALDESSHSIPYAVNTVMTRWENQGGFPVLTVRRTAPTADSVYVSQERYLTDNTLSSTDRWHVPINWLLSTNVDFSDTSPQGWVPPTIIAQSFDIPGLSQAEWFIFNKQQTGYYRVNYDEDNWQALANVLSTSHSTIHLLNRAQIIDDSFNLARNGRLNYRYPLEISQYMNQEKDYVPWASLNAAFNYLDVVLSGSDVYNLYRRYVLDLSTPLYEELGFDALTGEEHVAPYHRNIILNFHCRLGNDACIQKAQELLQEFRTNPSQRLNPDIQTTVFCSGLRGGDEDNFNFLWQQYLSSSDSGEQSILLNALGCTSNAALRDFYLSQVISDDSAVREQDRHTILVATINSGSENMEIALDFVVEHFAEIQPRVQGLTGTTNILNALAARLTTAEHSRKIDEFVSHHEAIMTAGEQASVNAIRTNIDASINWNNDNLEVVASWLRDNYDDSSANVVTSSFIIIISVIIAIFNY